MGQSKKRHYWLGSDEASEQDTFFLEALDSKLWSAGTRDQWDTCWNTSMPDRDMFKKLEAGKTINHIPGNSALTIKSNLHKTLSKAKQRVSGLPQEKRYNFYPDTYSMPEDYFKFQEIAAENPDWLWIQKPKNLSRGRGIEVVKYPEMVPLDSEWIIQRYLSKPHLWDGYKYVLRCYVLITSVEPLRFYWFHEGFAKLTSEPYSTEDLDNPYRHLTNPDINEDNTEVDTPVVFHSFKTYRQWLKNQGADDEKLFAELHDLIALTVIAARESMRAQSQEIEADTQGAYELIGLDCMVDSDLKPWILECNLSPSLETCSTSEEQGREEHAIKRQLVRDIVNILGLNEVDANIEKNEQQKAAYERERAGGFQCVFPTENANDYFNCFPVPRYTDIASLPENTAIDLTKIPLKAQDGIEAVFADSLALLYGKDSKNDQQFIFPNELATLIWLQNSMGLSPEEISTELTAFYGADVSEENRLIEIWDVLADWSQANLFVGDLSEQQSSTKQQKDSKQQTWLKTLSLELAGVNMKIRCACPVAGSYLQSLLACSDFEGKQEFDINIDILRSQYGYVLINDTNVIAGSRKLSSLVPELLAVISKKSLAHSDIAVVQGIVASINGRNTLIMSDSLDLDTWVFTLVGNTGDAQILSRSPILNAKKNSVSCMDLPLLLSTSNNYALNNENNSLGVVEQEGGAYKLYSMDLDVSNHVNIDSFLFLQAGDDETTDRKTIHALRHAEILALLWENCIQKQPMAASLLPAWLEGIQGVKVNVQKNGEDISLTSLGLKG